MAISRKAWGARGSVPHDSNPKTELYIHHTVTAPGKLKWTRAEERAHMQLLDRIHIDQNGWSAIGYNWVLVPSGRLYVGRGPTGYPAAQGGHNAGTLSISCVGDYRTQRLTRRQRLRLRVAIRSIKRAHRSCRAIGGHRDAPGQSTSCPGGHIEAWIDQVARKVGMRRL